MKRFKLYSIISVLIAVILFSTAALCNQCGIAPAALSGTSAAAESKTSESTTAEDSGIAVTTVTDSAATTSSGTTATATESEATAEVTVKEAPTIKLKIYEGPTFSAADKVCYYRVEAVVTGDPSPTIVFSKDDSNGAFGLKKVQINLTKITPSYTLTAKAKNSAGEASDSIALSWGCEPLNNPPVIDTISIISNGTIVTGTQYDVTAAASDPDGDSLSYEWTVAGGVLKGSESNPVNWATPDTAGTYNITVKVTDGNGGEAVKSMNVVVAAKQKTPPKIKVVKTVNPNPVPTEGGYIIKDYGAFTGRLYAGDNSAGVPSRGYISYDISGLAGATIQSATLTFNVAAASGDTSNLGELWVGIVDWGAHPLVLSDFDLPGIAVQSFPGTGDGNFTCNADALKTQLQNAVNAGKERFQARIHFSVPASLNNIADRWQYEQSNVILNVTYVN
jgi:hypothetical protein